MNIDCSYPTAKLSVYMIHFASLLKAWLWLWLAPDFYKVMVNSGSYRTKQQILTHSLHLSVFMVMLTVYVNLAAEYVYLIHYMYLFSQPILCWFSTDSLTENTESFITSISSMPKERDFAVRPGKTNCLDVVEALKTDTKILKNTWISIGQYPFKSIKISEI